MFQQHEGQIEVHNECLLKWNESHGMTINNSPPHLRLSASELDLCFEGEDNASLLSELGAVRLLGTIKAQCSGFRLRNNWKTQESSDEDE